MITLNETIRPSADLRNHYSEISRQCRENKEAVIITVNGRGDTVSLSYEEYKRMKSRIELLEILADAEDDVKNCRLEPIENTFQDLRKMLRHWKNLKNWRKVSCCSKNTLIWGLCPGIIYSAGRGIWF